MLESLYFWKGKSGIFSTSRIIIIILVIALLLCGACAGYWYYFIKMPQDEMLAQQQQAAQKLLNDKASVHDWYEKSLEGMSIDFGIRLIDEIHRSVIPFALIKLPVEGRSYGCSLKACHMTFEIDPDAILTQPELTFFGKTYAASFPVKKGKNRSNGVSLEYNDMKIARKENGLLSAYKKNKPLSLYSCNEVISYIKSYNSTLTGGKGKKKNGEIVFKTLPKSTVAALEKTLAGDVKAYGMLSAEWNMTLTKPHSTSVNEGILLQVALYKQAYRDAFLIRKIETINDGIKVSGGLVCKA